MSLRIYFYILILFFSINDLKSDKCIKNDLEYKYTECDKTGHRWLVSVPKRNKSCDATSEFIIPKVAKNCGDPCNPGTYLDVESQECKDCPSGTYSQGDTIEINNWKSLPPGFATYSIDIKRRECKREEWIPKRDFISASVSNCQSYLSFTASLYKEGKLRFEYQMPEESTFFVVKVVHDECRLKTDDGSNIISTKYMDPTGTSIWSSMTIPLRKGQNFISWIAKGSESDRSTVKITNLRITNSIFSSQCTNCSVGYFSSARSSMCTPCTINKYSEFSGSDQCKDCPEEEYSLPGSKSCSKKVSCVASDYSYKWTECDKDNKRKKVFFWIEPMQCSKTAYGAVKLPKDSDNIQCEPCPKGTFLNESSQQCQFCPPNTMSSVAGAPCTQCSLNTKPVLSILYDKWSHLLPNLTVLCIKGITGECKLEHSWIFNGDHLQSSMTSDSHFLQFDFQTDDRPYLVNSVTKSSFSFRFSLHCSGYCDLHLFLKKGKYASRLNIWFNSTDQLEYRHYFPRNTSGTIVWYFTHNSAMSLAEKSTDHVKIFWIQMTNLRDVGAIDCRSCDPHSFNNGCLDCEKGKYFSKETHVCELCPLGHILKSYPGQSIDDCVRCGAGLVAFGGTTCLPNVTLTLKNNQEYDLSNLKGYHLLKGNKLFDTHGQEFVHVFNMTLFSGLSFCRSNISSQDGVFEVTSPVCRITILTDKSQNNTIQYAIQVMSVAEKYDKIEQSNVDITHWRQINDSLIKNGFDGDNTGSDLHVYLSSDRKTEICTKGRVTIVTLRCETTLKESQFMLPSKCPVETCDGCNFHFLIKSRSACPYCRLEDFTIIKEECIGGHQKIHFQTPKYCILRSESQSTEMAKCPLVTMRTTIVVVPTVLVLIFLIGVVVYCYKKNQKLQYKYMRLVSGNEDNEHILTGAESCGMNDGDEEDDDVKIKTNSKSGKMFARFNKPSRNRKDYNDMETVNLNDNPEFDI